MQLKASFPLTSDLQTAVRVTWHPLRRNVNRRFMIFSHKPIMRQKTSR